jgi:hypothetical protein
MRRGENSTFRFVLVSLCSNIKRAVILSEVWRALCAKRSRRTPRPLTPPNPSTFQPRHHEVDLQQSVCRYSIHVPRLPRSILALVILSLAAHAQIPKTYIGFDRNVYPGDTALPALRRHFDFTSFWLTNPPGSNRNTWTGKRAILAAQGFGFLALANGRTESQIKAGLTTPAAQGQKDATTAAASAQREGFPPHTLIFLDQEEGGRLTPEQSAYLFAWTETLAATGFRPGTYVSGQPVPDGPGQTITTAQDIQQQVAARHLHPITLWVYQDTCPPSNGCVLTRPPLASSGTPAAEVWQYAQSPRRRPNTAACAKTYAPDNNCYAPDPAIGNLILDLNVAATPDPSHGR